MRMMKLLLAGSVAAAALLPATVGAQEISNDVVKIGILNDQIGRAHV